MRRFDRGAVKDWSSEEFDEVLRVNVHGTFEFIKAVLSAMRRQCYRKIVNISSGTVFKGTRSKRGVSRASRYLRI